MGEVRMTKSSSPVDNFMNTVKLKSPDLGTVLMPVSALDNRRMAQIEVSKLGTFISDWMSKNKDSLSDITPTMLKDLSAALKIKQEIADKAYGKTDQEAEQVGGIEDELEKETQRFVKKLKNTRKEQVINVPS